MQEVQGVANRHPYLVTPGASDYGGWAVAGVIGETFPSALFLYTLSMSPSSSVYIGYLTLGRIR